MMIASVPSVNDTYFQHKVLTKIHGQPSYECFQNVSTELKANATSVTSTLGGGQNGHLGLLLSNARYIILPHAIPWGTPGNPGPFVPPVAGTGPQIEAARDAWRGLKQDFETCQATDKALIAQLVESIDSIYLRVMLNRATGQYSGSIRAILQQLFQVYGKVTPQQIKAKNMELYNMHYDISQPVDTIFNCIGDLSDLADHAMSPSLMTEQQIWSTSPTLFLPSNHFVSRTYDFGIADLPLNARMLILFSIFAMLIAISVLSPVPAMFTISSLHTMPI
jgi:hypothetical protein